MFWIYWNIGFLVYDTVYATKYFIQGNMKLGWLFFVAASLMFLLSIAEVNKIRKRAILEGASAALNQSNNKREV